MVVSVPKGKKRWLYDVYYRSGHWHYTRKECLERAGWSCEIAGCTKPATQAHHTNYACLYHEEPQDLIAVCGWHHLELHGLIKKRPANDNQQTMWDIIEADAARKKKNAA